MDETPIGGEAEAGPAPSGEPAEASQPEGGEQPVERRYVEVDDPDSYYVKVKANDEEREVPLSEALRGYSATADYTRKTQELARQREEAAYGMRLQQALESNPGLTLQILAQNYGLNVNQAQPEPVEEPEFGDPLERQLYEERQARERLEQRFQEREADAQLERAINGLRSRFNLSDDDVREVVTTAYNNGLGIETLPLVYQSIAFERIHAKVQAAEAQRQQTAAEQQRRQAAAQQANQLVSSGMGVGPTGITQQVEPRGNMSLREAIEAAFDAAGVE